MDVYVDKARAGDEATCIDLLCPFFCGGRKRGDDFSVVDIKVADFVSTGGWVDYAGVGNPEGGNGVS